MMARKAHNLIIGFDMDGVIIENTASKIKFARQLGFNLKPKDTPADVIENAMPAEALDQLRQLLYHNPETALQATLISGAKTGLTKIKKYNFRYFLISRRKDPALAQQLLRKRGLWPEIFDTSNAFFVQRAEDKNVKAAELGVNLYIDDQPSVLVKLTSVRHRLLFDRFRHFGDLPFEHKKIISWREILSYLI